MNLTVIYGGSDDDEYSDSSSSSSSSDSICDGLLGALATALDDRYDCRCDDDRSSDSDRRADLSRAVVVVAVVCHSRSPVSVGDATREMWLANVTLNLTVFLGSAASSSSAPSSSFRSCVRLEKSLMSSSHSSFSTAIATGAGGGDDDDEPTGTWRSSKEGCLEADLDDSHSVNNCSGIGIDASTGAPVRCSSCRSCLVENKGESLAGGGDPATLSSFELDCRNVADGGEGWEATGAAAASGCRSSWDLSGLLPILLPDAAFLEASAAAAAATSTATSASATRSSSLHSTFAGMAVVAVLPLLFAVSLFIGLLV